MENRGMAFESSSEFLVTATIYTIIRVTGEVNISDKKGKEMFKPGHTWKDWRPPL